MHLPSISVLTVLRGHQRIEQVLPVLSLQCDNLSTGSTAVRLEVERLPEVVDRRRGGVGSDVEEDADAGEGISNGFRSLVPSLTLAAESVRMRCSTEVSIRIRY